MHIPTHTYSVYTHSQGRGNINTEQPWIVPGETLGPEPAFYLPLRVIWAFPPSSLVDKLAWVDNRSTTQSRNQCLLLSLGWTAPKARVCLSVDVFRMLVGPERSAVCLEYTSILSLRFQWCILLVRSMSLVLWCPMWKSKCWSRFVPIACFCNQGNFCLSYSVWSNGEVMRILAWPWKTNWTNLRISVMGELYISISLFSSHTADSCYLA